MQLKNQKNILIIGDPVAHSLSPQMHNAAYKKLKIENNFIFTHAQVKKENLKNAIKGVRALNIKGLAVTMPHKIEIMKYLDVIDKTAKKIGAVNTVLNKQGKLIGYNTDWQGIIIPLEMKTKIKGKNVSVLGAGGATRAILYGILKKGGKIKIFNRSIGKAKALAQEFNCKYSNLDGIEEISNYDIVINATAVGMGNLKNKTLLQKNLINKNQIIFDTIYFPQKTKLIKDAISQKAKVIYGYEMLLNQGVPQFKIFTGKKAPKKLMEKILLNNFK